jgi:hypothetical protein
MSRSKSPETIVPVVVTGVPAPRSGFLRRRQFMKNKLLIVADLGLVKAYKVEFTLEQYTPRLEQLEELGLEDAHNMCDRIRKNIPRDLTKLGEKELLDQFLNANSFAV